MNPKYYIACDLGAESGRVMLGRLEEGLLTLEEIHRFPSAAVRVLGSWRWDVLRIFEELKAEHPMPQDMIDRFERAKKEASPRLA